MAIGRRALILLPLLLLGSLAFAGDPERVPLELTPLDLPFNFTDGFTFPSMRQSLEITKDVYQLGHQSLARLAGPDHVLEGRLMITGFDFVTAWLPLSYSWEHEEWHRAVMSLRGVSSFDDIYKLEFSSTISVSHETDADLSRMKREHPADFVRLQEAGNEAQYELILAMEKDAFFEDTRTWNIALYWFNDLNAILYLYTSASGESNTLTDQFNQEEGTAVESRDFTGLDFDGWVYDLFRPDEPYEARGPHPSGVGINRYRKFSDLTPEEQDYLRKQANLSLLNLVDPNLFGITRFKTGELAWNLALRHHLTSFGYVIDANLFYKNTVGVFATLHAYSNHDRWFPGLDLTLVEFPLTEGNHPWTLSPRLALWLQPAGQMFRTADGRFGGMAAMKLAAPFGARSEATLEVEQKSPGWVAGNVYLDAELSARVGVRTFY